MNKETAHQIVYLIGSFIVGARVQDELRDLLAASIPDATPAPRFNIDAAAEVLRNMWTTRDDSPETHRELARRVLSAALGYEVPLICR